MSIFAAPSFYSQRDQDIYNQGFFFQPRDIFSDTSVGIPGIGQPGINPPMLPVKPLQPIRSINQGGGGGIPFSGTATDLTTAFQKTVDDRQNRLNNPSNKFFGFDTMRDQQLTGADAGFYDTIPQERTFAGNIQDFLTPQSADDIIAGGYEPRMKLGIFANLIPDRFGTLPRGDQAFIARNMGYTGPTVFGQDQSGLQKDPFGLNVRSGFGNYAERVGVEATNLGAQLGGRLSDKYGAEFDEETGMFVGPNAAKANQMTKMMRAKFNFYREQTKQRDLDRLAAEQKLAEEAKAKQMADAAEKARLERLGRDKDRGGFDPGGATQASIRASREDRSGRGQSGGFTNPGRGSYGPFMADGGRVQYMMGGLADLVDIYD
jgi:hypothetical protein